jgi:hypothetical protein
LFPVDVEILYGPYLVVIDVVNVVTAKVLPRLFKMYVCIVEVNEVGC